MANLLSRFLGKDSRTEDRFSLGEAAALYGDRDPFGLYRSTGGSMSKEQDPSTDFLSMINQVYKQSGVVFAVMQARASIFSEARFQFRPLKNGQFEDRLFGKESLSIFEKPWQNGTTGDLLMRAIQDADLGGNHYVVTEGVGSNKRLRRLRPDWVSIVLTEAPSKAVKSDIAGYIYKPGGSTDRKDWVVYPVDGSNGDIAHWAPIPDPDHPYRGMSWLTPVLREIMADKQATRHKLKFFENGATPNLAVTVDKEVTIEQFREFKREMENDHQGVGNAYKTLYLGAGADVTVVGADLHQMDFKVTQGAAETRIAAAGRVHPAIVGLSEGLQGSSLNASNFGAAKTNFGDGTLRPLWRSLCASYAVLVPEESGAQLWYDDSDISFLRQDRKEQADLQKQQQAAIAGYVMQGFTPESAVDAIYSDDIRLLKHTGLVSVQLLPPGTVAKGAAATGDGEDPDSGKAKKDNDPKVKDDGDLKAKAAAAAKGKQGQSTTNTPPQKK